MFNFCTEKPNGKIIEHYDNDSIKSIIHYKNGLKDGDEFHYYPSGNLASKFQWYQDTLIYEQNYYFNTNNAQVVTEAVDDTTITNQPIFKRFTFVNWEGKIAFERKYDKDGNMISQNGNAIIEVTEADETKGSNNQYKLVTLIAIPPYSPIRSLKVQEFEKHSISNEKIIKIFPEINRAYYTFSPSKSTSNNIRFIYSYGNEKSVENDTLTVIIPR
jgi:hypothetical protein